MANFIEADYSLSVEEIRWLAARIDVDETISYVSIGHGDGGWTVAEAVRSQPQIGEPRTPWVESKNFRTGEVETIYRPGRADENTLTRIGPQASPGQFYRTPIVRGGR